MTNLDSILKSRDITLPTKVGLVKAMFSPVVIYGCESWTIKKAEHLRIDAFALWCWRRLLRVPWTARRSNQSILKESVLNIHWKDWCWSWNSNTLATCCEKLTHLERPWCWERLKVGGEGDDRGWDGWMVSPARWTWVWVNSGSWWWTGKSGVLQSMGLQRAGQGWATVLNWREPINPNPLSLSLLSSLHGLYIPDKRMYYCPLASLNFPISVCLPMPCPLPGWSYPTASPNKYPSCFRKPSLSL